MTVEIAQYIETFTSPDGRTGILERLYPVVDETGEPLFSMPGNGLVDFEVVAAGRRHTLRCPLLWDDSAARRLRSLAARESGLEEEFFAAWRLMEGEVVLFSGDGRAFEVDVLVRPTPEGVPIVDFIEGALARGDIFSVETVGRSFERLVEWSRRVGRGGITPGRLIVTSGGGVRLTGFSAIDETVRIREMIGACIRYEEYTWDADWGVATVMTEGRWGVVDALGGFLTTDSYDWLGECSEGYMLAQKGGKCGFIDVSGREAIPFVYDDASSFSEGCALVSRGSETFFIDPRGERI
jgi:hypothetical protein